MDHNEEVKRFLETCSKFGGRPRGFMYNNLYDFVLKNGKRYIVMNPSMPLKKKGECFRNAFLLAEKDNGLKYTEGYAYTVAFPMLHAWTVDKYGIVYDPTWEKGKAYYGVEFPLGYVREISLKRKKWGVLDCLDIGWPLLTGEDEYPIKRR